VRTCAYQKAGDSSYQHQKGWWLKLSAQKHIGGALSQGTKSTVLFTVTLRYSFVACAKQGRTKLTSRIQSVHEFVCLNLMSSFATKSFAGIRCKTQVLIITEKTTINVQSNARKGGEMTLSRGTVKT
jgi:hypothetical protein